MATAIIAFVDEVVDAIRGLAAALIGKTSHEPAPDDEDEAE